MTENQLHWMIDRSRKLIHEDRRNPLHCAAGSGSLECRITFQSSRCQDYPPNIDTYTRRLAGALDVSVEGMGDAVVREGRGRGVQEGGGWGGSRAGCYQGVGRHLVGLEGRECVYIGGLHGGGLKDCVRAGGLGSALIWDCVRAGGLGSVLIWDCVRAVGLGGGLIRDCVRAVGFGGGLMGDYA